VHLPCILSAHTPRPTCLGQVHHPLPDQVRKPKRKDAAEPALRTLGGGRGRRLQCAGFQHRARVTRVQEAQWVAADGAAVLLQKRDGEPLQPARVPHDAQLHVRGVGRSNSAAGGFYPVVGRRRSQGPLLQVRFGLALSWLYRNYSACWFYARTFLKIPSNVNGGNDLQIFSIPPHHRSFSEPFCSLSTSC